MPDTPRPTTPRIDVLIPVFNAAPTIRDAIASIQNQTMRDIRIVVVNDGSTDATAEILAEIATTDARIDIFTRPNGGIVDALNFGLAQCRAHFLARHDGDDLADPERFARQIAYLEANPDCVAVGGAARHIDEHGRSLSHVVHIASPEGSDPSWAPSREPYILHPFLMTYVARVRDAGGYRYVFHAEDTDLYWRLQETGRLHNLDDVLGDYRMHTGSVSSASVINGRVSALNSQLAGISAMRRRQGQPDLTFSKEVIAEYAAAGSLERIFRIGARQLRPAEVDHLEVTLAAKLMELTSYRPFELDLDDCLFIRRAFARHGAALTAENRAVLRRMCSGAAARMVAAGQLRRAMILVRPWRYAGVVSRLAFRTLTPPALRRFTLRATGRATFFK